ncbi:YhfC family intramembrane metalloprotease [Halobacillus salinarum]|uniref:YhfC family intramembrane metalloprotease n=1 Tax=Halobacillus salinarum TaxID=2932257 RepID=A0ABY4EK58_9BACI|nr:YhfC family intramembrane metalloprotease [Halobacillus salinarum]UOQ44820.1 YhfC family intramembrane metalloprotease [Halobacillus salinarum]
MISPSTLIAMCIPGVFSILLFIGLILFYRKKTGLHMKPLLLGAAGFIVFTQILEKTLHAVVVNAFPTYADHPWLFGLYGGLAAGHFEELGRFILFIWLLKKFRDYKTGVSLGIGWGGIEAVLLMVTAMISNLTFAFMINAGTYESTLGGQLPADQLATIKDSLLNQNIGYYLLACVERFFSVFLQIALSLLVLYGVVKKKFLYVVYAILIHAVIDYPLVFVQTGYIKSLWLVEVYVAIIGILAMVYIKRMEKVFPNKEEGAA